MGINKVMATGNLTREPELRSTASGMAILDFGLAINDRRKNNQTGQWEDYANFVDCNVFGNRATAIAQYLHKGTKVAVEGKLHYSSWEDRNSGQKRSKLEIIVDEIEFMTQNSQQNGYQQISQYQQPAQQGYQQPVQPMQPVQQGYQQPSQQPMQPVQQGYAQPPTQQLQQQQIQQQRQMQQQPMQQQQQMQQAAPQAQSAAYSDEDIPF